MSSSSANLAINIVKTQTSDESSMQELDHVQSEILFPCLPDIVLLKVFGYLNLTDSINLAVTCRRVLQLSYSVLKKCEFTLVGRKMQQAKLLIKNNLPKIGHAIHILTIDIEDIDEAVMNNCVNVEHLRIHSRGYVGNIVFSTSCESDRLINFSFGKKENDDIVARDRNRWIKQLNLKSIWFNRLGGRPFFQICDGITNLEELKIVNPISDTITLLGRNLTVKRLSIILGKEFDFRILRQLQQLQCLHLCIPRASVGKIFEFVNFDGLIEFSVESRMEQHKLISFLRSLAEKTNLHKMRLCLFMTPNADLFRALNVFNLTALELQFSIFESYTESIQEIPSPGRLKYLKLMDCPKALLKLLATQWTSVETICLHYGRFQYFDKAFLNEILQSNTDRETLKISVWPSSHNIELNFKSQQLKMIKNYRGCLNKHVFQFGADDCNMLNYSI